MWDIELAKGTTFNLNSQVSKKFTLQVSSWFFTTKGVDYEVITHDRANLTSSDRLSYLETFDAI